MSQAVAEKQSSFLQKISNVFKSGSVITDDLMDNLEEILITADLGIRVTDAVITEIKEKYSGKKIESEEEIFTLIKQHMIEAVQSDKSAIIESSSDLPTVMLFVGVNGTGKTTSIGKISKMLISQGKKVILGAGDTFRAAAGEQLGMWAERTGADIVQHKEGGDPAAVIFDAVEAGVARKADYILLDTAGRLHTKADLMKQLEKITRVIKKKIPDAPHEVLLVLDATAGQNGLAQAKQFFQDSGVTGIFLAKLDGTAKGGIVFAIKKELDIPVKFIGVGEGPDDLNKFKAEDFVERIFFADSAASFDARISKNLEQTMSRKKEREKKHGVRLVILLVIMFLLALLWAFSFFFADIWVEFTTEIMNTFHVLDEFKQ